MFKNFFIIVLGLILFSACSQANDVVGEKGQVDTELAERDIVEKDVVGNELTGRDHRVRPPLIYGGG